MSPSTTFAMDQLSDVAIENVGSGDIVINQGSGPGAAGTIECDDADFLAATRVRPNDDTRQLRITLPRQRMARGKTVGIFLEVPVGVNLEIEAGSADIAIGVAAGRVRVAAGSGDVFVRAATELTCSTGSGDIHVRVLKGTDSRLTSGSGDIDVDECEVAVQAKSGSGDVTIRSLRANLRASSGSGDISVPSTSGSVDLRSASGSLSVGVADGLAAWLDLNTVSGDVTITLPASPEPAIDEPYVSVTGRTASGDISVFKA